MTVRPLPERCDFSLTDPAKEEAKVEDVRKVEDRNPGEVMTGVTRVV